MTSSSHPSAEDIAAVAARAVFGKRLVTNVFRGLIVEAIIDSALGPEWNWCSADYASWDFVRKDRVRMQVKQSAAQQSWDPDDKKVAGPRVFDIGKRGLWEDKKGWTAERGRWAEIYLFAYHSVVGSEADQRDPAQWRFYVIRESELPTQDKLSLARVRALAPALTFDQLRSSIDYIANHLPRSTTSRDDLSARCSLSSQPSLL